MNSLCAAVVHSEHRVLWKHIDLNQSVCVCVQAGVGSLSPHCSRLPGQCTDEGGRKPLFAVGNV